MYSEETICHYCDEEADYQSMVQDMVICKGCVKEYIRQEVLTCIHK